MQYIRATKIAKVITMPYTLISKVLLFSGFEISLSFKNIFAVVELSVELSVKSEICVLSSVDVSEVDSVSLGVESVVIKLVEVESVVIVVVGDERLL